jgi:hypothetical protein
MEMEANHHYGDKFTRFDQSIFWIRSFLTCFINPQRRNKDPQMHSHNLKALTKKPQPGTSQDMLKLLRIQVSETFVVEFDSVDTRFNDCSNWQVMKGEERVLFSTRMYEQFRDVKSGLMATVQVCEAALNPLTNACWRQRKPCCPCWINTRRLHHWLHIRAVSITDHRFKRRDRRAIRSRHHHHRNYEETTMADTNTKAKQSDKATRAAKSAKKPRCLPNKSLFSCSLIPPYKFSLIHVCRTPN